MFTEQKKEFRDFLFHRIKCNLAHGIFLEGVAFKFGPSVAAGIWNLDIHKKALDLQADAIHDCSAFEYYRSSYNKLWVIYFQMGNDKLKSGEFPSEMLNMLKKYIYTQEGKESFLEVGEK